MSPRHSSARAARVASLALVLGGALVATSGPTASSAGAPAGGPDRVVAAASAHGSFITGNRVLGSGKTAHSAICTTQFPKRSGNNVAGSKPTLAPVADLGGVETTNVTSRPGGVKTITSTARVARGSLFEGRVTFAGLHSESSVAKTPRGFSLGHDVDLVELAIDGNEIPIGRNLKPATYRVPGLGSLHVNFQKSRRGATSARSLTEVLRLELPDGTSVRIGRSYAKMHGASLGTFRGSAWGSDVTALDLISSGRTGHQPLPCRGTNGKVLTNDTANAGIPGVVRVGTTTSTAQTKRVGRRGAKAITSANVADVKIAGGRITLDAIRSRSTVVRRSNGSVAKHPFSRVLGLEIDGEAHALPVDGRALVIPGLAKIETALVTKSKRNLGVTALRVTLLEGYEHPVVINLGNSKASVSR